MSSPMNILNFFLLTFSSKEMFYSSTIVNEVQKIIRYYFVFIDKIPGRLSLRLSLCSPLTSIESLNFLSRFRYAETSFKRYSPLLLSKIRAQVLAILSGAKFLGCVRYSGVRSTWTFGLLPVFAERYKWIAFFPTNKIVKAPNVRAASLLGFWWREKISLNSTWPSHTQWLTL